MIGVLAAAIMMGLVVHLRSLLATHGSLALMILVAEFTGLLLLLALVFPVVYALGLTRRTTGDAPYSTRDDQPAHSPKAITHDDLPEPE
jgi:hypothetical protein